jgi:hypothetical protein
MKHRVPALIGSSRKVIYYDALRDNFLVGSDPYVHKYFRGKNAKIKVTNDEDINSYLATVNIASQ